VKAGTLWGVDAVFEPAPELLIYSLWTSNTCAHRHLADERTCCTSACGGTDPAVFVGPLLHESPMSGLQGRVCSPGKTATFHFYE